MQYDNPLTSYILIYDGEKNTLLLKDGLLATSADRLSIHPMLHISLEANETKIIYIKAHAETTPLILKLNLWNINDFYAQTIKYQIILALFFGALGLLLFYNFIIYISIKEISYLYYLLSFISIFVYYLFYKGVMNVYFLPNVTMKVMIDFSSFIVAFPVLFLALFTRSVLVLKEYPLAYQVLNYFLIFYSMMTVGVYYYELNEYRSILVVGLLLLLLIISFYTMAKGNRQAKFLSVGLFIYFISGLLMLLSSTPKTN